MLKLPLKNKAYLMAERMGFEPMKELLLYTLSKRAPSTTRPPLLKDYLFLVFSILLPIKIILHSFVEWIYLQGSNIVDPLKKGNLVK